MLLRKLMLTISIFLLATASLLQAAPGVCCELVESIIAVEKQSECCSCSGDSQKQIPAPTDHQEYPKSCCSIESPGFAVTPAIPKESQTHHVLLVNIDSFKLLPTLANNPVARIHPGNSPPPARTTTRLHLANHIIIC